MKKLVIVISIILFASIYVTGCASNKEAPNKNFRENIDNLTDNPPEDNIVKEKEGYNLLLKQINGSPVIALNDFASTFGYEWQYNRIEGIIEIKDDKDIYWLLKDTPVISKNGLYLPNSEISFIEDNETIFLPIGMLYLFDFSYEANDNQTISVFLAEEEDIDSSKSLLEFEKLFPNMTAEDLYSYLSFLSTPLEGSHITPQNSQIPGAKRTYRNGIHEGIDWYSGYTGISINETTPVLSMSDGIVVRADHNYTELTAGEREEILVISANMDQTPEYILDMFRGRSVWIQYMNGVNVRYAHLSGIPEEINVGDRVKTGDVIGYVGNSGTSDGVIGSDFGYHLHSDILIYGHLFWEFLELDEIRELLDKLFPISE